MKIVAIQVQTSSLFFLKLVKQLKTNRQAENEISNYFCSFSPKLGLSDWKIGVFLMQLQADFQKNGPSMMTVLYTLAHLHCIIFLDLAYTQEEVGKSKS